MDEAPKKGNPSLSIDRAAFLLLRVKKAFKRKRQQRKDRLAAQQAAAAVAAQTKVCRPGSGGGPPPLLRSRTLPTIVVPGVSILQAQIDSNRLSTGDSPSSCFGARWSLQPKSSRSSLVNDDSQLEYRRKSSGSTHSGSFISSFSSNNNNNNGTDPHIYPCDDYECYADGTVVLRIPAPHVVAARAYRMPANSGSSGCSTSNICSSGIFNASSSGSGTHGSISGSSGGTGSGAFTGLGSSGISGCSGSASGSYLGASSSNITTASASNNLNSGSNTAIYRIARLLNQTAKSGLGGRQSPILKDEAPRRLSWERRVSKLPRSSSIDSMVEAVWNDSPRPSLTVPKESNASFHPLPTSSSSGVGISHQQPSQLSINYVNRRESLLSPSSGRRTKQNRGISSLFSAVEHSHLEKARTILESTDVDVNSLNTDGLSPLDVAVLSNNRSMTKMLLQHGAIEGSQFKLHDSLGNHLNSLLHDAENRIQDLSSTDDTPQPPFSTRASFSSIIGNSGPSVTGCTGTENDKQLGLWERRVKGLRRMLLGWDQARPPDYPSAITIDIVGPNSVAVCILEPLEGSITTKFKVQWSTRADFSNIVGEREIIEWTSYQGVMGATCRINELTQGRRYFFRSNCGNVKGWGQYKNSIPSSVIPSSWRDLENKENRFAGRQRILDDLFTAVRLARPGDASELSLEKGGGIQRRNPKKKTTIKQLFSAASKFQKNLRRGIYLACILYYEDKILVTNEDFIPVIEIDETYPSSLHNDYYWLMKVACTWDDVKSLRTDMERNSTSATHFRTKLLSSACQMQSALCITDLGQLYHKPLRDSHGTIVLSCVNSVKSPKTISVLNSRWIPINKIQKKVTALHEDNNVAEILISSINEQIAYHQTSSIRLSRGLYLGYLKMQSSVEQIQIVVPAKTPNVLPHCKIRDNPHISSEEWGTLKDEIFTNNQQAQQQYRHHHHHHQYHHQHYNQMAPSVLAFRPKSDDKSEIQKIFLESLTMSVSRLFSHMNISPDDALLHRLYDVEVIELSPDVSFLIVCPPVESSCAVPGQREILLQRGDLLSLPIQAFEMIHLRTYQNSIIQKYSRLSCILELDTALANHSHREAFSTSELQIAKERLAKLHELSSSLNAVWKGVRWLMDVIGYARDRNCVPVISMREILEYNRCESINYSDDCQGSNNNLHLLQLPQRDNKLMKSSPGRGSWPGPAATNNLVNSSCYLGAEHSKSEQNLGLTSLTPTGYLSINSGMADTSSRKNSADSQSGHSYFSAGEGCGEQIVSRLPPSRSEDTLVITKKNLTGQQHRKRSTTCVTTASAQNATTSTVKTNIISTAPYKCNTDSLQSLSSDSDSSNVPVSKGNKKIEATTKDKSKFLKNKLTALQGDKKNSKEPLHISEPSSPCTERPRRTSLNRYSDNDEETVASSKPTSSSGAASSSSAGSSPLPGIIQVYAAYETGLASGTSLKLHVTSKTSAREVVDLVIKQLNMAVVLKGKDGPIYTADKLNNFCLVAVIGARERCLRDDFKPLQLQNPWKKGKLYVRQKHDLLAAIEHSNRETHLI